MDEESNVNHETSLLAGDNPQIERSRARTEGRDLGTATLGDKTEVLLLIGNDIRRFMLDGHTRWILGRFDKDPSHPDQIDLSPYGALDHGVSRFHLELQVDSGQLFATDLNSTNGSYLNGEPLAPKRRILVHNGDELLIGRLAMQILFR